MGNGLMSSRETFQGYSTDSKLDTLFDYMKVIYDYSIVQQEKCDGRFKRLEKRKLFHSTCAGVAGLIGGFMAGLLKRIIY